MQIESDARTIFEEAMREAGFFRFFAYRELVQAAARWVKYGKPSLVPSRVRTLESDVKRLESLIKYKDEKIVSQSDIITNLRLDQQKLREIKSGSWWRRFLLLFGPEVKDEKKTVTNRRGNQRESAARTTSV